MSVSWGREVEFHELSQPVKERLENAVSGLTKSNGGMNVSDIKVLLRNHGIRSGRSDTSTTLRRALGSLMIKYGYKSSSRKNSRKSSHVSSKPIKKSSVISDLNIQSAKCTSKVSELERAIKELQQYKDAVEEVTFGYDNIADRLSELVRSRDKVTYEKEIVLAQVDELTQIKNEYDRITEVYGDVDDRIGSLIRRLDDSELSLARCDAERSTLKQISDDMVNLLQTEESKSALLNKCKCVKRKGKKSKDKLIDGEAYCRLNTKCMIQGYGPRKHFSN